MFAALKDFFRSISKF